MTVQKDIALIAELRALPRECEWVEFKQNLDDAQEIGQYISALANSAALADKQSAYMVWGIADGDHTIVGTNFDPEAATVGNEGLLNWLTRLVHPHVDFSFKLLDINGHNLVLLTIPRATHHPVRFKTEEFIRIGSYKKKLREYPEKERELWRVLGATPFENHLAAEDVAVDEVLRCLDYPAYFQLLNIPLPDAKSGIVEALEADNLIARADSGNWHITNLGAMLFANQLSDFTSISRKAMRVIVYSGTSKVDTVREQEGAKGYAAGFEGMISFINGLLPTNEVLGQALRKTIPMFPELAVRELVANALIHQDFFVQGSGPMVEIYTDRMEISNPGIPLMDPDRFLDMQPRSRNERLAGLMRRLGICEERGSGVDKVVAQLEIFQLPPALFEVREDTTIAVLFAHRPLAKMDKSERVRACYQHACLKYVMREFMTNASIRTRFGIEDQNKAQASRIIRDAVSSRRVLADDPDAAPKFMKYVPFWAKPVVDG